MCSEGAGVSSWSPTAASKGEPFDIAIFDLQIGSMGGMAVTLALRLDESAGVVPHVPVVMLLDRVADVHLARRSGAEGWMVKPLDPLRLRRAVSTVMTGGTYVEGIGGTRSSRRRQRSAQAGLGRVGWRAATGCSAAWLARHVRDVEAGSSNLPTPTPAETRSAGRAARRSGWR